MSLHRIFLIIFLTYALAACGGSGSGSNSGYANYSDTGTYETVLDDNGDPEPLMLRTNEEGVATVTSSRSNRTYTLSSRDENGNIIPDMVYSFVEESAADLRSRMARSSGRAADDSIDADDLGIIQVDGAEDDEFANYEPEYQGDYITVFARDAAQKYQLTYVVQKVGEDSVAGRTDYGVHVDPGLGIDDAFVLDGLIDYSKKTAGNINLHSGQLTSSSGSSFTPISIPQARLTLLQNELGFETLKPGKVPVVPAAPQVKSMFIFRELGGTKVLNQFYANGTASLKEYISLINGWAAIVYGGEAADYENKVFYMQKTNVPRYFQGAVESGVENIYEIVKLADGEAVYPKKYDLNYVYAQEQDFDGETYYYLGYLYKYKKDSEDALYFTTENALGDYTAENIYRYDYNSFDTAGTFEGITFYLYNNYHDEVIEKPMMTYSGKKLDYKDITSYETVTDAGDNELSYGVASYDLYRSNLTDGKYTFDINFTNVGNDALTITYSDTTYNAGDGTVEVADEDASDWISFNMDAQTAAITPQLDDIEAIQSFSTYAAITDGYFVARVHLTADVSLLTVLGTPPATATVGEVYSFTPAVTNSTGALSYSLVNAPNWLSFDDEGVLTGTPGGNDVGTAEDIRITIEDENSSVTTDVFSITVESAFGFSNSPSAESTTVAAGSGFSFTPVVENAGGAVIYSLDNNPGWLSVNPSTGVISGTPPTAAATYSDIILRATSGSDTDEIAFSITVPNQLPTITGMPSLTAYIDTDYSFVPAGTDANGDTVTFLIDNKPDWAVFNQAAGSIGGIPTSADIGTYSGIVIYATDGTTSDKTLLQALYLQNISVANDAPEITNSPASVANVGTPYSYVPIVEDENHDAEDFEFSITGTLPTGLSFDDTNGSISGTPTATGTFADITITVSDGTDTGSVGPFSITVAGAAVAQNFTVLKTGQTTSYVIGDDGTYQAGRAKNLSRDGVNEIVTDSVTGLIWQDVADNATDTYNWADAGTYCDGLSHAGYDDWRLPTILELMSIINYGTSGNAIYSTFVNTSALFYWSSTVSPNIASNFAYTIDMDLGSDLDANRIDANFVRCVR